MTRAFEKKVRRSRSRITSEDQQVCVRVPRSLHRRVKSECIQRGQSMVAWMRSAIEEELERRKKND